MFAEESKDAVSRSISELGKSKKLLRWYNKQPYSRLVAWNQFPRFIQTLLTIVWVTPYF